jgi:hypothetical protein
MNIATTLAHALLWQGVSSNDMWTRAPFNLIAHNFLSCVQQSWSRLEIRKGGIQGSHKLKKKPIAHL